MLLLSWRLQAPALTYGLALVPQLGTLTTARLTNHSSACKIRRHGPQFHPLFLCLSSYAHRTRRILLAIIHGAGNLFTATLIDAELVASYRIVQLPPAAVPVKVALTISGNSSLIPPRLIHDCPCRRHHPHRHPHRHRTYRVLPMPSTQPTSSSPSYSSPCIVLYNFPLSVTWRAGLRISRSTSIFSQRLIRDCPCGRHHHWYALH